MSNLEYHREYYKRNKSKGYWLGDKNLKKNNKLMFHYKITLDQYNILLESQNGKCAICNNIQIGHPLSVDHDHKTKKVRALLCKKCNSMLGFAYDRVDLLESAISYLRKHSEI